MSNYIINPIGGGTGFKVNVSNDAGGVRVVGIFRSETAAAAWIIADRCALADDAAAIAHDIVNPPAVPLDHH